MLKAEAVEKAKEFIRKRNLRRYGIENEQAHITPAEMAEFALEIVRTVTGENHETDQDN